MGEIAAQFNPPSILARTVRIIEIDGLGNHFAEVISWHEPVWSSVPSAVPDIQIKFGMVKVGHEKTFESLVFLAHGSVDEKSQRQSAKRDEGKHFTKSFSHHAYLALLRLP